MQEVRRARKMLRRPATWPPANHNLHAVWAQSTCSLHAVCMQSAPIYTPIYTNLHANLHQSTRLGGSQSRLAARRRAGSRRSRILPAGVAVKSTGTDGLTNQNFEPVSFPRVAKLTEATRAKSTRHSHTGPDHTRCGILHLDSRCEAASQCRC